MKLTRIIHHMLIILEAIFEMNNKYGLITIIEYLFAFVIFTRVYYLLSMIEISIKSTELNGKVV